MKTANILKFDFFRLGICLLMFLSYCLSSTIHAEETSIDTKSSNTELLDILGTWKTIDDETGEPKSIIEITAIDGIYSGKVLKILNSEQANPICDKCKGEKANQAIEGMVIIENVKKIKDYWSSGTILDPKKGKTYKVKFTLIEGGKQLKVRGYIGLPTLGRTQTWLRD